jgi:hypothetical protein
MIPLFSIKFIAQASKKKRRAQAVAYRRAGSHYVASYWGTGADGGETLARPIALKMMDLLTPHA